MAGMSGTAARHQTGTESDICITAYLRLKIPQIRFLGTALAASVPEAGVQIIFLKIPDFFRNSFNLKYFFDFLPAPGTMAADRQFAVFLRPAECFGTFVPENLGQ